MSMLRAMRASCTCAVRLWPAAGGRATARSRAGGGTEGAGPELGRQAPPALQTHVWGYRAGGRGGKLATGAAH